MELTLGNVLLETLVRGMACGSIGKSPDAKYQRDSTYPDRPLVAPDDATGISVDGPSPKFRVEYTRVDSDKDRRDADRLTFSRNCENWWWTGNAWISDGSLLISGERGENGSGRGALVEAELELTNA